MEADGAAVTRLHRRFDRRAAGGPVGRAQRLHPPGAAAAGKAGVSSVEAIGEGPEQGDCHKGHVPRHDDHRGRRVHDRGQNPSDGAEPWPEVPPHAKIVAPGRCLRGVRDQQRSRSERLGADIDQPIENPPAADLDQALGLPAEPAGRAPGQDRRSDQ